MASKTIVPFSPRGITLEQAKTLRAGDEIYSRNRKTGGAQRWKVTSVKTWKRDPNRIEVRIKHGLYTYDFLTLEHLSLVDRFGPDDMTAEMATALATGDIATLRTMNGDWRFISRWYNGPVDPLTREWLASH